MINGIQGLGHILNELGIINAQTQSIQDQSKITINNISEKAGVSKPIHSDKLTGVSTNPVNSGHQVQQSVKAMHPLKNEGLKKPGAKVNMKHVPKHHVADVKREEISLSRRAHLLEELRNPELAKSILSQKKAGARLDRLSDVFDAFSTASRLEVLGKSKNMAKNTESKRIIDGLSEIRLSIEDPISMDKKEKSRDMELFSSEVNVAVNANTDYMSSDKVGSDDSFVSLRQANFQSHGKDGISFRESRNKSRSTDGVSFRQPVSKALSKDSISFRQTVLNRPAKDTISFRLSDNQAKTPKSLKESIRDKLSTGWSELHKPRTLTMDSFYLDNMKKNNKHFNSLLVKLNEEVSIWQLLKNGGRLIIGTYMFVLDKVNSLGTLKKEQDKKQTIGMLLKEKKPSFGESLFSKYFGMSSKNDSASQMQDGLYSLFKSSDSSHSEKSAGSGGGSGATTGAGGGGNDGSPSIQNKTSEGDIPQDISVLQFKEMQKEVLELSKYFRSIVYKFQVLTMILNHVTGDTKNFLEHFCTIINESITPSEPNENESTVKNKNKNTDFSKAFQNNFVGLLEAKDQLNNLSYNVMDYYSDTKTKVLDGLSDEKKESLIEQLDMSKEKVSPETFNHVHKELTDIFSMHSKMKDYFSEKDDVVNKIQFNLTAKVA